jgi:type IX secretion system PorP/SprF family membrane protein
MSIPSFSNIDRWLFERMEGNLSTEQLAQLQAFLLKHPELDVDQDMWELAKVDAEELVFPNQQRLLKREGIGWYAISDYSAIALVILIGLFIQFSGLENVPLTQVIHPDSAQNTATLPTLHPSKFKQNIAAANSEIVVKTKKPANKRIENSPSLPSNGNFSPLKATISSNPSNNLTLNLTRNFENTEKKQYPVDVQENFQEIENSGIESDVTVTEGSNLNSLPLATNQNETAIKPDRVEDKLVITQNKTNELKETKSIQKEDELTSIVQEATITSKSLKLNYGYTMHNKMRKIGRSIQRMMDNPIALKNRKDTYYHIPGMQAMDVNFGSAGTMLATRVQSVSRAQWLGQENQQIINQLSIDGYSYGMRGGVGFQFNHNYYGKGGIENYHASLLYSPKFSIARNVLIEPSIRFKMGNKSVNSGQLQSGSIVEFDRMNSKLFYSPGEQPIGKSLWYKDLGLGLMVNTKWFYVGIQGDNLLEHYDNIYSNNLEDPRRAGKHFVATIGTDYESKKEKTTFSPYFVYQKQEKLEEGWLGMNFRYHWLMAGAAISTNLEPAASLGLNFDHFMLTYNADYTYSQVLNKHTLSHQLTIRFLTKPSRFGQRLLNQAL